MKIAFLGAGFVNFGGLEGPWDHASRLEKIEGIEVVAIVDPLTEKASAVCMHSLRTIPSETMLLLVQTHGTTKASLYLDVVTSLLYSYAYLKYIFSNIQLHILYE